VFCFVSYGHRIDVELVINKKINLVIKIKQDYAIIKTDALAGTCKFSSEAYSGPKQSLPTFCRSKLFS
jgi:hypothetical protein